MIWVGLPAYNEAGRISDLLKDIHKSLCRKHGGYKIVVYDDGSTDATVSKVLCMSEQGVNIHLIKGVVNKGLGFGLSNLLEYCLSLSSLEDIVIIMDADTTHIPQHIHRMLTYIEDGFEVVIASRYTPYSRTRGLKLKRQIVSNMANFVFRLAFPIRGVRDYTCAYRAYTSKILKVAKEIYGDKLIEEDGFACMAELLIKLKRLDILMCEVPLILRYDRKAGASKMDVVSNIFRSGYLIMRLFFMRGVDRKQNSLFKEKYGL